MKKLVFSFLKYLVLYLIGFIAFYIFGYILNALNGYLAVYLPRLFKTYNPITSREELLRQNGIIAFISSIIAVFITNVFAVQYDNTRFEAVISETDGLYPIASGARIYLKGFLKADIFAALTVPVITYPLVLFNIPNNAPKYLKVIRNVADVFIVIPASFSEIAGFVGGIIILISVSVAARAFAVAKSLFFWRASWLTSSEY